MSQPITSAALGRAKLMLRRIIDAPDFEEGTLFSDTDRAMLLEAHAALSMVLDRGRLNGSFFTEEERDVLRAAYQVLDDRQITLIYSEVKDLEG